MRRDPRTPRAYVTAREIENIRERIAELDRTLERLERARKLAEAIETIMKG